MKIELELPDWVEELHKSGRHIYVFAGIQEIARKKGGKDYWEVKQDSCNQCGECCKRVGERWGFGVDENTGWCKHLIFEGNEYRCGFRIDRPFGCCISDHAEYDHCSINWKKIE